MFLEVRAWADQERPFSDAAWKRHSSTTRTHLGLPKNSSHWTSRDGVHLHGISPNSKRQIDLINAAFEVRRNSLPPATPVETIIADLYVNVSQSISTKPWARQVGTLTTSSQWYHFGNDVCLSGMDHMVIQGWPRRFLYGTDQAHLHTLAGEATSMPVICMLELLMWANPWGSWHERPLSDSE